MTADQKIVFPHPDREIWQYGVCTKYYTRETVEKMMQWRHPPSMAPDGMLEIARPFCAPRDDGALMFQRESDFIEAITQILKEIQQ